MTYTQLLTLKQTVFNWKIVSWIRFLVLLYQCDVRILTYCSIYNSNESFAVMQNSLKMKNFMLNLDFFWFYCTSVAWGYYPIAVYTTTVKVLLWCGCEPRKLSERNYSLASKNDAFRAFQSMGFKIHYY